MNLSKHQPHNNFLFVYLAIEAGYVGFHHGIAYLVPVVRKHSYNVSVLTLNSEISDEEFREKVKSIGPTIVGFSCVSPQFEFLQKYSHAIKELPSILQVAGGAMPTLEPLTVLSQTAVQGVFVGEGERSLAALLDNINHGRNITETEGMYWNSNGSIKKNPVPTFILDLSELDFPDPTVFDAPMVCTPRKELKVMLSRGCPYECTYCSNKALKDTYPSSRGYLRIPTVEWGITMLKRMMEPYPEVINISFEDDLLIGNKKWFGDFSREYKKKINLPYRLLVRPETVTTEIIKMLKESGCYMVVVGVESGDEQLRKTLLNRNYSNKLLIEKCKMLREAGIFIASFNVVGWPFETREAMMKTLELNREIGATAGVCSFFYPFKGTELYSLCKKEDLLKKEEERKSSYSIGPNIKLTRASEEECISFHKEILTFLNGGLEIKLLDFSYSRFSQENQIVGN